MKFLKKLTGKKINVIKKLNQGRIENKNNNYKELDHQYINCLPKT